MKLHLDTGSARKIFTAHGEGYVAVSGERFEHPVAITPERVLSDWQPQDFDALEELHFDYFLTLQPELVLLGTGVQQRFAHPRLYQKLTAARIAVECMNTAAACRTYNILVAEERKVVAAILL